MEEAVTNSTALIFLAKIDRLDLLETFGKIIVTTKVRDEVIRAKDIPQMERSIIEKFFKENASIKDPANILPLDLGPGETSAIAICTESKTRIFISDDRKARRTADVMGIQCMGTIGIILANLKNGSISKNEARSLVNKLIDHSYYISTDAYVKVIGIIEDK
ncbi:MAG: DUF3368 domain-containing protein [Nanoarchaeota archaeon]